MADATAGGAVPIRTLFISTAFSILISLAVFAVSSMLFVFPVIARQDEQIQALNARINQMHGEMAEQANAPAPAPAPPAAPAPAPAAAPPAPAPAAK